MDCFTLNERHVSHLLFELQPSTLPPLTLLGELKLLGLFHSNQCLWLVRFASQMGLSSANGAVELVSSFLVTTCFAKWPLTILPASFVLERGLCVVLIVRVRDFVQSGWKSLLFLSSKTSQARVQTITLPPLYRWYGFAPTNIRPSILRGLHFHSYCNVDVKYHSSVSQGIYVSTRAIVVVVR